MLLRIGGLINILVAIVNVVGLFWAEAFFESRCLDGQMQRNAEIHPYLPYIELLFRAIIFFVIGLYGFVAGGAIKMRLPLVKIIIYTSAVIFLLRAVGGYVYAFATHMHVCEMQNASLALITGLMYLFGARRKWRWCRKSPTRRLIKFRSEST